MFSTTVTVDAHQSMAEAVARTEGLADSAHIVVRWWASDALHFYVFTAKLLRKIAEREVTASVLDALSLSPASASRALQADNLREVGEGLAVVLDGNAVLGVVAGGAGDRGVVAPPEPHRPPILGLDEGTGLPAESESAGAEAMPGVEGPSDAAAAPDSGAEPFTASTVVEAPDQVAVGRVFDVTVGLSSSPQAGGGDERVVVHTDLAEFDLVVSVAAPGFFAPRTRDVLHVVRANPRGTTVTFSLTAEPIEGPAVSALLRVDFSYGGVPCGSAWHAIAVIAGAPPSAIAPSQPSPPSAGVPARLSTEVKVVEFKRPPDLVVTITENIGSTELEWQFGSRHPEIVLPSVPVRVRFHQHDARSFAMQQVRLVHESIGDAAIAPKVMGVARTIANAVPPEAWQVLTAVWKKAEQEERLPSVLVVSTDAYIPWELASTELQYLPDAPTDASIAPILGAQVCISRWTVPAPLGSRGVLNPPQPPPEALDVRMMTLVIGDYLLLSGKPALPRAMEEGDELAALYRGVKLTANLDEVNRLFHGTLERDGTRVQPDLIHFACHGEVDGNPRFNGIILNDGNARLDALYVRGRKIDKSFVFMNACQIGQSTQLLEEAGGFASSFLVTGASGFIAPLWNVNDQVAKDAALDFYAATLEDGVEVAEALRRRRALFDPTAERPEPTHLAYVYYGNPNLVLTHIG